MIELTDSQAAALVIHAINALPGESEEPCCHLCCAPCGALVELEGPRLDEILRNAPHGFHVEGYEWWNNSRPGIDSEYLSRRIRPCEQCRGQRIVTCQFGADPHPVDDECQTVTDWARVPSRVLARDEPCADPANCDLHD